MVMKRLLLFLKPFDAYRSQGPLNQHHKVSKYFQDRILVHKNAISFCQNILNKKSVEWKAVFRDDLSAPIRDVDLVISLGGDGTLLQTSHFIDDSIPVLGVNSDPTRPEELIENNEEFDATRSAGYLCAATSNNFEKIIDEILENRTKPSELARMAISVNSKMVSTSALNDVLLAHRCPATVSRLSFRKKKNGEPLSSLIHSRSSGIRVSTAAGSTAAMLSAGGLAMPILSKELQYMVREPISPGKTSDLMHGFVKMDETMHITWFCGEGFLYIDGSHVFHPIQHGDTVEVSSKAPALKVYLTPKMLSDIMCKY